MSLGSVYVRARDGALYREPLWVFPEGFVCFDESEPPEIVLWIGEGPKPPLIDEAGNYSTAALAAELAAGDAATGVSPALLDVAWLSAARAALSRVFGFGAAGEACSADVATLAPQGEAQRVVPGTDPMELNPARSFFFEVTGRPPRPTLNQGTERYPRRAAGTVFDWPAAPLDAAVLEMPK